MPRITYPALLLSILVPLLYKFYHRRLAFAHISGPGGGHFLLGAYRSYPVDLGWIRRYGNVVKYSAAFGEQRLLINDPKALHYIMQTAGYGFVRTEDKKEPMRTLIGKGILTVEGDDHRRQRRIMLPSFGSLQANSFVPSFAAKAAQVFSISTVFFHIRHNQYPITQMADMIAKSMPDDKGIVVDIPSWYDLYRPRSSLMLRSAAFDYQLNALEDPTRNKLVSVYYNLFTKTRLTPTNLEIFLDEALALVPKPLMRWWNDHVPDARIAYMRRCREAAEDVARELPAKYVDAARSSFVRSPVVPLTVRANAAAQPKARLDEDEVYAQLLTILLAGHETTANALSWAFFELAQRPDIQSRLRTEIRGVRASKDDVHLTAEAIQAMPYLNAVVKEILRFHSPVYSTSRTATKDDVIPLERPLFDQHGRPIFEIAVPKGQYIAISIAAYSRERALYGADADIFNPERWLQEGCVNKHAGGGIYSNLLTFGGGHRGCLGWRFAVLEMSAFIIELVDKFRFSVSPDIIARVYRGAAGVALPMMKGETAKGVQLPLHVKRAPQ
ncbi:cytochrome P450 [Schizophyllum commune H4-8]|uniref:Cytochrome P450 n=1 Tax=Schizophyllum commune (strain H4-8 / FGSC 9210) TaxID=578458 RepID=D8PUL6_SCHCM|nr:cytochrome P450 [Schizophyllum commune H4-8]KAI5899071.1 cytochrome P450 [Schizophyllum commune H4-8]